MKQEDEPTLGDLDTTQNTPGATRHGSVGRFRMLEAIGEGGMGEVFLAEQLEPVRRRVALKLIKLGMDSKDVVARFESERQALAMMSHPNIAQVYEAGLTDEGRPYFAMEYVAGVPIHKFVADNKLDLQGRLELFMHACEGVQHAHQKGIIHRDIKPSNVLVTMKDDEPMPKIIDFGIAKATAQKLTEQTLHTQMGQIVGTPDYMSPEQAEMSSMDIDTRTDVYSLGVLLYELLTGLLPFDPQDLRSGGYDGIRKMIREDEPKRPSKRLTAAGAATYGPVDESRVERMLSGDLDWIVLKAMEKDRARRYPSPSELAADVDRFLHNIPVVARPPSRTYRLGKFVRRNKVGVVAAGAIFVALALGAAAATVGLLQAREASRVASREAETAQHVVDLLVETFAIADPNENRGNTVTAREVMDRSAERLSTGLADEPEVRARLQSTLGLVYQNLGLLGPALEMATAALDTRVELFGDSDPATATSYDQAGTIRLLLGDYEQAKSDFETAIEIRRDLLGESDPAYAESLQNLAAALWRLGEAEEGEQTARAALAIQREALPDQDPAMAVTLRRLGNHLWVKGDLDEAEDAFTESLEILESRYGQRDFNVALMQMNTSVVLSLQRRFDEAEPLVQSAIGTFAEILGEETRWVAQARSAYGYLLRARGDLPASEREFRLSLRIFQQVLPPGHPATGEVLNNLAGVLVMNGEYDDAEQLARESLVIHVAELPADHWRTARSKTVLGAVLAAQEKDAEAEPLLVDGYTILREQSPDAPYTIEARDALVAMYERQGRIADADRYR